MNEDKIIELAIQGHANTRDAIRWAIQQEREACAKVCEDINIEFAGEDVLATWCARAILERGEKPPVKTYCGGKPNYCTPEQEPVYAFRRKGLDDFCTCDKRRYDELAGKPDLFEVAVFYTAPVDAVNMTPDRVDETAKGEHEPVAWRYALDASVEGPRWIYIDKDPHQWLKGPSLGHALIESLYTAPPKREWVGLTGDEISECWGTGNVVTAVEAKLKEKNCE